MTQGELFDTVNEFDVVVGRTTKSEIYLHNNYRVINAFLRNSHGQLWIPRRSPNKLIYPLCLDASVGGHVKTGESYDAAFHRETKEELNLIVADLPYRCIGYLTPLRHRVSAFMKVYEINSDVYPQFNPDEIVEGYWLYPHEIAEILISGEKAKSDLEELLSRFYLHTSKDDPKNCRVYDLSHETPDHLGFVEDWILEYCKEWQSIKDIDNRSRISYPNPLSWAAYYSLKAEIGFGGYRNYHIRRLVENYPFYQLVLYELEQGMVALEIGIGAGTGILELTKQGKLAIGIDIAQDVLELVMHNSGALSSDVLLPKMAMADLFSLPFPNKVFDVSYSHGTFEHFPDRLAILAIKEAVRVSKRLVFAVPTSLATIPINRKHLDLSSHTSDGANFGDERLHSVEHWEMLVECAGARIERKYGYWIPQLGSKTLHPEVSEAYYGVGVYAAFAVF